MTQTLQEFLDSERKEFEDLMVLTNSTVNLPLWLSSHDTRVLEFVREEILEDLRSFFITMPDEKLRDGLLNQLDIFRQLSLLTPPTKVTDTK